MIKETDVIMIQITDSMKTVAINRANMKSEWLDTWKNRSDEERFNNFLDGQLGEEAVKQFLIDNNIPFFYYDDIRSDGFKKKDLYDFKVKNKHGQLIEISVKSSKLKKPIDRTIKENKIIAYPGSVRQITIQPFIDQEKSKVFLLGWASKEELEKTTAKQLPGDFSDKPVNTHQVEIINASSMGELPKYLGY